MNSGETAAEAKLKAGRDKEIALANADLQKQLTGNETAYATAVNKANSAYDTATTNAVAVLKSAKQTALSQLNSALAQSSKDKDTAIAGAERTYDQLVAALDAQYGSLSSNGDTGIEGARRDASISTRDAQYYASRDTSWAGSLSGSTTIGNTPWTLKAIASANAQAAYSTNRARAQAAHDAALLSAIDNWQTSNRSSTLSLLLAEGQSREAYNKATATVYANWELGIGNLRGDKPAGTAWSDRTNEKKPTDDHDSVSGIGSFFSFDWFGDEEDKEDTSDLPEDPSVAEIANDKIVQYRDAIKSFPLLTPYGKPIRSGILKGIRDWGIDVIAGGIALAAHDTIKKVEPTANADASFFLNWFGTSSIPSMMMGYNKVGIQSVDYVQSIARENALELNTGHALLGSSATPFLDQVTVDGILSLATMGAMNALTKGAQLSRRISQVISESTIDVVQRIDDDVAQVIAKAGKSLDTADAVPLEKLEEIAPNNTVWNRIKPTQDVWPGTEIPRSFELTTQSGQRVWVHGNATEHLAERVVGANGPRMRIELGRIVQQSQLTSLEAAVNAATTNGIPFNQPIRIGGWELIFRPGRNAGDLPALVHALPLE